MFTGVFFQNFDLNVYSLEVDIIIMNDRSLYITLANNFILAYEVRPFLGYIWVAEFENSIGFTQLALVLKIWGNVFFIFANLHALHWLVTGI